MTEESTRTAVHDLYQAYAKGDGARVAELIDDNIDWVMHGPMDIFPFAGHRQGKAAVLEALAAMARDYLLERYVPQVMVVDGDAAAVLSDVAFRQRSTDRMISFHIADFLRFRDGRVVEFREFSNTFDVVEQALGHVIPL